MKEKIGNSIIGKTKYNRIEIPKPILYIKPKESATQLRRESKRILLNDETENSPSKRIIFQKRRSESTKSLRIVSVS